MHVEQVSKNIGEHGRLQSLVETFIGQAARWWDTHQTKLQSWTTASNFFVERFGGKKLTQGAQIPIFVQCHDPEEHIKFCEKEWRRLGHKDERAWPHLFPSTLADLPNKWYKMEEARGEPSFGMNLKKILLRTFSSYLKTKSWLGQHTRSNSFFN